MLSETRDLDYYTLSSDTKCNLRNMSVDSLTPLQEELVESCVGRPQAYVHKETGELAEDRDAARRSMEYVLRRMSHRMYINILVSPILVYRNHDLTFFRSRKDFSVRNSSC